MQKKLLAAAVAAAVAAPGVALAQSSVTISGFLKVSVNQIRISQAAATRTGNKSETRFVDDGPSRITFSMREDLGGGLAAVGQLELRHTVDGNTSFDTSGVGSSAGNMFVGLQSSSWGLLRFGSVDRHYVLSGDTLAGNAPTFTGSMHVGSTTTAAVSSTTIGGGTRTRNQIGWDSPNWNGFTVNGGWSARQVSGQEADLTNVSVAGAQPFKRGNAWFAGVRYDASNWYAGLSYLNDRADPLGTANNISQQTLVNGLNAGAATQAHSRQWRAAGRFNFGGGFGIGLTWDRVTINTTTMAAAGNTSARTNNRTAWAVPFDYTTGPHSVGFLYSRANDDKSVAGDQKSTGWSLRYIYALSKRTTIGAGYAQVRNNAGAAYNISGDNTTSANAYSSANAALTGGEDARVFGMNVRHAF